MALPSVLRAALPIACNKAILFLKYPSLSASRIAINVTSGRSSPSRKRFIPTITSISPFLNCSIIFGL